MAVYKLVEADPPPAVAVIDNDGDVLYTGRMPDALLWVSLLLALPITLNDEEAG